MSQILNKGNVGIQPGSNVVCGPFDFEGGAKGMQFTGPTQGVTVRGFKHKNPHEYGIYMGAGLKPGPNLNCTFYDVDIALEIDGYHCWRIYNAVNLQAFGVKLKHRAPFQGTTLALKQCTGGLFCDLELDGLAPALGALPLPSEENYLVQDVVIMNPHGTISNPFEIASNCSNITLAAYPGRRSVIYQEKINLPCLNIKKTNSTRPEAMGITIERIDWIGGKQLVTGNTAEITWVDCTYNGQAIR